MSGDLLGRIIRPTFGKLALLLFRTRFYGVENVPTGGVMLAGNHVSYMDPIILWSGGPRPVHFMAKRELWDTKFFAWALPRLWAFPVSRGEPDRGAITTATSLLESGELVGVFPEGTRAEDGADELRSAQGGAAFIALRAGVPVVPVAFLGTDRVWPRGKRFPRLARVTVTYGTPIDPKAIAPDAGRKQRVEALTATIMDGIAAALETARRR